MPKITHTLYSYPQFPRGKICSGLINHFSLPVEVKSHHSDPVFASLFPLRKVPAMVDNTTGETFHETVAVVFALAQMVPTDKREGILGRSESEFPHILKWAMFVNSEFLPELRGLSGFGGNSSLSNLNVMTGMLEKQLGKTKFLAGGEDATVADFYAGVSFTFGFGFLFDKKWKANNPNIMRWYNEISKSPIMHS